MRFKSLLILSLFFYTPKCVQNHSRPCAVRWVVIHLAIGLSVAITLQTVLHVHVSTLPLISKRASRNMHLLFTAESSLPLIYFKCVLIHDHFTLSFSQLFDASYLHFIYFHAPYTLSSTSPYCISCLSHVPSIFCFHQSLYCAT